MSKHSKPLHLMVSGKHLYIGRMFKTDRHLHLVRALFLRKTVVISSVVKDGASGTDTSCAATLDFIRQFTTSQDKHVAMMSPRLESHLFASANQNFCFCI